MSDYRCVSNCISTWSLEFYLGLVPYFCGDWSWNNFYSHSPPLFSWFIQEGLLSVKSEVCTWSTCKRLFKLAQEKKGVVRWTDCPLMTIAVEWDVKHQIKPKRLLTFQLTNSLLKGTVKTLYIDNLYHSKIHYNVSSIYTWTSLNFS